MSTSCRRTPARPTPPGPVLHPESHRNAVPAPGGARRGAAGRAVEASGQAPGTQTIPRSKSVPRTRLGATESTPWTMTREIPRALVLNRQRKVLKIHVIKEKKNLHCTRRHEELGKP